MTYVIAVGALLGAVDCIRGNRNGLGAKFEEGFLCLGATALGIAGIICIAPVLGNLVRPVVVPLYRFLRIDPAMFGSLLANNMGGYPLATELADNEQIGKFSGLIVASMMGAALVYTIPVGLGIVSEPDKAAFIKGIMIGMIPIPLGAAVGGVMMGLPAVQVIRNCTPVILIAIVLILGFSMQPERMVDRFLAIAKGIRVIAIAGLGAAAFTSMTGIVLIPGMQDLEEAMDVVIQMGIVQLGSLPLAALFLKWMKKPLEKLGKRLGMNAVAVASMPVSCVNVISVFTMVKDMNQKGIVISAAWCTNAIALFTAHLAYTRAAAPDMVAPVITAKLVSASAAVVIACFMETVSVSPSEICGK